jgi:hypothetical protein
MPIIIEKLVDRNAGVVLIDKIHNVMPAKSLPRKYMNGYPKVFGHPSGVSIVWKKEGDKKASGDVIVEGDYMDTDYYFNEILPAIRAAGDRLHQINDLDVGPFVVEVDVV